MIYKVFRPEEWAVLTKDGATKGAPIDLSDGYIHFSTATQLAETLAKHFAGVSPLVLCGVEDGAIGDDLRWEPSRGGALFPHLYREMSLADVAIEAEIEIKDGVHALPAWVK